MLPIEEMVARAVAEAAIEVYEFPTAAQGAGAARQAAGATGGQ